MRAGAVRVRADDVDKLGKPVDAREWGMTPQTVNAYYNPTNERDRLPGRDPAAAVLRSERRRRGELRRASARVIGHEISHGFDDQGRKSDGDGNLRDWWTADDAKAFEARADEARRAVRRASRRSPGMHVNGKLTLGENIGDLGGLAVALRRLQASRSNGKPAPVIDGFTGDQRFFLGWAQVWRTMIRDEALRQQLLTDPHSPGEFRVNGVVRNMPEFYRAFGVKEGDGACLPPDKRVKIW